MLNDTACPMHAMTLNLRGNRKFLVSHIPTNAPTDHVRTFNIIAVVKVILISSFL